MINISEMFQNENIKHKDIEIVKHKIDCSKQPALIVCNNGAYILWNSNGQIKHLYTPLLISSKDVYDINNSHLILSETTSEFIKSGIQFEKYDWYIIQMSDVTLVANIIDIKEDNIICDLIKLNKIFYTNKDVEEEVI